MLCCRYRYRSQYVRPPSQMTATASNNTRTYQDDTTDDSSTLSTGKRGATTGSLGACESDYNDDISPYAVFPMPKSYSSSTRRMKTFVVEKHHPLEMSNYAAPDSCGVLVVGPEPTYDYIAPCGSSQRQLRKFAAPKLSAHSVFVPIPVAVPPRPRLHSNDAASTWNHRHRTPSDWNNQETLAMSHRL